MPLLSLLWSLCLSLQKKLLEEELEKVNADQWTEVQKSGKPIQENSKKGKEAKLRNGVSVVGNKSQSSGPSNQFAVLSSSNLVLEEGEIQRLNEHDDELKLNSRPLEQTGPSLELISGVYIQESHPSSRPLDQFRPNSGFLSAGVVL